MPDALRDWALEGLTADGPGSIAQGLKITPLFNESYLALFNCFCGSLRRHHLPLPSSFSMRTSATAATVATICSTRLIFFNVIEISTAPDPTEYRQVIFHYNAPEA